MVNKKGKLKQPGLKNKKLYELINVFVKMSQTQQPVKNKRLQRAAGEQAAEVSEEDEPEWARRIAQC